MTETQRPDAAGPTPAGDSGSTAPTPRPAPPPTPPAPPLPPGHDASGNGAGGSGPSGATPDYQTGGLRLALLVAAVVALGVLANWMYVWIILGIVVMITLHELGHFVTAKWSGMKVTEFFFGFGPKIWSVRKGETEYGIKVLPAGAYVRIIGMNNLDEADPADEPRTYRQQSFPKRVLVASAGSIMHFAQAFVLLAIAIGIVGIPGASVSSPDEDLRVWPIVTVNEDSPAAAAGFEEGDEIVAVAGRHVSEYDDGLTSAVRRHEVGDDVEFTVERDGRERTLTAELGPRPDDVAGGRPGTAFLGVSAGDGYKSDAVGLGTALWRAPGEIVSFTGESLGALAGLFSPDGLGDYANNVRQGSDDPEPSGGGGGGGGTSEEEGNRLLSIYGAVRLGASLSEGGLAWFLLFLFQINIFIGIFNMVPLPPLDGGHVAVAVYERIRSRRGRRYQVDMAKLLPLTYAVVMVLAVLGITAFYLDIVNPVEL
jgi:membrane-associated protease RseP (regulator of RpoE activity)